MCIVVRLGEDTKRFCADQGEQAVADLVESLPEDAVEDAVSDEVSDQVDDAVSNTYAEDGVNRFGNFLKKIKDANKKLDLFNLLNTPFSLALEVEYRCCVCTEDSSEWGEKQHAQEWFNADDSGVRYHAFDGESYKTIAQHYKEAIEEMADTIAETCELK